MNSALRRRLGLACLGLFGGLTGCVHAPEQPRATTSPAWVGRMALSVVDEPGTQTTRERDWSAGFELQGSPRQGELALLSPLGTVLARVQWNPQQAVLLEGDRQRHFANLADLTRQLTGTELPVTALFDWLAGRPTQAQGWQVDLEQHASGRIQAYRLEPQPRARLRLVFEAAAPSSK